MSSHSPDRWRAWAGLKAERASHSLNPMIPALVPRGSSLWRLRGLALCFCLTAALRADAPPNDQFADRIALYGPTNHVSTSSVGATRQAGEPPHLKVPTEASVWWSWTAPDSGVVTINTEGSDFDTALAVYTGSQLADLALVARNDDATEELTTSVVTFQALAGVEYQIAVDGPFGESGSVALNLELPVTPSAPSVGSHPQGLTLVDRMGSHAIFSVGATGSYPLYYQWQFDTTNLPGAIGPELLISDVVLSHAGAYRVVVSNAWGWVVSSNATLRVTPLVPNDGFADRVPLRGPTNVVTGSTLKATREPGEPNHLKMPTGASIWWAWIASDTGPVMLTTAGSDFDTTLSVYTGSEINALTLVAKNDDAGAGATSSASFQATGGTEYQIAVDGSLGAVGSVVLTVALPVTPTAPEIVRQPLSLAVGEGSGNSATFNAGITGSHPRFYQWQFKEADLPGATEAQLTMPGVTRDAIGLYRLIVSNAWGTATSARAMLNVVPPVLNDHFGNRIFVSGTSSVLSGALVGATAEPGEPSHANPPGGHSIWWSWIAPANGRVELSAVGTNLAGLTLTEAVYTGSAVDQLTLVARADGDSAGAPLAHAALEFWAAAGTAYQIAVDGDWDEDLTDAVGVSLRLSEQTEATAVPNDNFAARFIIIGATNTVTGSNVNTTREPGEPNHLDVPNGASVWWSWIAPDDGPVTIDTFGSSFDTTLSVYTGDQLADLQLVAENDDLGGSASSVSFQAEAGTIYQIVVDGFQGNNGEVVLHLALPVASTAPLVTDQPEGLILVEGAGATATFSANVSGSHPRSYQWQLNGADLPGATGPQLMLANVVATNAGLYAVVVTNAWGRTVSSNATLTVLAPIPNDDFAGRIALSGPAAKATASNVGATRQPGEPRIMDNPGGWSLWWSWTAPSNGLVSVDTRGSSFNTMLGVYTGTGLESLTPVAQDDDSAGQGASWARFRAMTGVEYQIQVDGLNAADGLAALGDITVTLAQLPDNDFFAHRLAVPQDATMVFDSNAGASREPGEPDHTGNAAGRSVWWSWTPASNTLVWIDTRGSSFAALLAVYTGAGLETLRLVDQDNRPAPEGASRVGFVATAGTEYLIAVDGDRTGTSPVTGDIVLNLDRGLSGAGNDSFVDRIALAGQTNVLTASNEGATKQPGEPNHAGGAGGSSVWWSWVAPLTGPATISTVGSGFDTLLAVYTGPAVDQLQLVAENDDSSATTSQSRVVFDAIAGTEYDIAVDGYRSDAGPATGSILLAVLQPTPPTPGGNDDFAQRYALTDEAVAATGSNTAATKEPGEPAHAANPGGRSIWWSWVAPASGPVTVDTAGSTFDTVLVAYTGAGLDSLVQVAADDGAGAGHGSVTFMATAGTEYQIVVDGYNSGAGAAAGAVALSLLQRPSGSLVANDDFENRTPFLPFATTASGFNPGATGQPDEPRHAGVTAWASLWWSWTAPGDGPVTLDTRGSGFDTVLSVYTGTELSALMLVAENDDIDAANPHSQVRLQAEAGTEYQIAVDGYGAAIGRAVVNVQQDPDAPSIPIVTQPPADQTRFQHGRGGGSEVRFSVVATGSLPLAYQWQFNQSDLPGATEASLVITNVTLDDAGAYRVRIARSLGEVFSPEATLRVLTNTFNDNFADRIPATGATARMFGSCLNASKEGGEPNHAGATGGQSVWWSWVAPTNGLASIETVGSSVDTLLAVYTGSAVGSLSPVAQNDDIVPRTNKASRVRFPVQAGIEYQIAIDAAKTNSLSGSVVLDLRLNPASLQIVTQPAPPVLVGDSVVLDALLADPPPSWTYQWFADDRPIPGANQRNLALTNLTRARTGAYALVVGNAPDDLNGLIALHVIAPQRLRAPTVLPDGRVQLTFSDPDGSLAPDPTRFEVLSTSALQGAQTLWQTNSGKILQQDDLFLYHDPLPARGSRFYRVTEK